jgi:hypothetical protein
MKARKLLRIGAGKCRRDAFFELSPLLAYTCTPGRRKSFISTHITNDPLGWGPREYYGVLGFLR